MRILSFSSEKRHMKHSCLHVQTREKMKQQLRFAESYNCHSLYCENCYHSIVVIVQLILPPPARFTCSLKLQSTTAFIQSTVKQMRVCLCDISYSHLIVQHKQKISLSLTYHIPFHHKLCMLFLPVYLKIRPTTTTRNF